MEETESQIAKISLGNSKSSNTYVYVMAEKAPASEAELYVVAELPLFNPAAEESCERICLAIGSTLKRAYRKPSGDSTFENAISQINEELGKLASMGQTNWIYKLNCILGAKDGNNFHIATCGKVSSYLLRNGQFTDISCSQKESHPLKTFENFASGKIRLGDLLLLSTTQLFNHLSMDRILNILENGSFLTATQTIIQLLKDTSDPQTSFGVLLNLQVMPGQVEEESVDLENYVVEEHSSDSLFKKAFAFFKTVFAMDKSGRKPQTNLPKVSFGDKIKNISGGTINMFNKSKGLWQSAKTSAEGIKNNVSKEKLKSLSPIKKFFIASIIILLIALISSVFVAMNVSKTNKIKAEVSEKLTKIQSLLETSQSSLLYKDFDSAGKNLLEAKNLLPKENEVPDASKEQYKKIAEQLALQEQQMARQTNIETQNLGSLGQGESLIDLPDYLAVQSGNAIISYNLKSGQMQDNQLNAGSTSITANTFMSGTGAGLYDGSALYVWDFAKNTVSSGFNQSVPSKEDFGGIAYYPTNNRVYVVDKKNSRIVNFLNSSSGFSRPVVSLSDPILATVEDITIDSSIYVLTKTGISKYQAGKLAEFNFPTLPTPYSGSGKIYTDKDSANVYILDKGNNRVIVTDKTGNLIYTLKSDKFTKLIDFSVNEKSKTIYLLNDGSLLKAVLP